MVIGGAVAQLIGSTEIPGKVINAFNIALCYVKR